MKKLITLLLIVIVLFVNAPKVQAALMLPIESHMQKKYCMWVTDRKWVGEASSQSEALALPGAEVAYKRVYGVMWDAYGPTYSKYVCFGK